MSPVHWQPWPGKLPFMVCTRSIAGGATERSSRAPVGVRDARDLRRLDVQIFGQRSAVFNMAAAATIVMMPMKVVIFRPNHSKPPWIRLAPMDPLTLAPSVFFTFMPQLSTADHFGVLRSRWKPRVVKYNFVNCRSRSKTTTAPRLRLLYCCCCFVQCNRRRCGQNALGLCLMPLYNDRLMNHKKTRDSKQ